MRTVVSILAGCFLLVAAGCRREPARPAASPDPYRGFLARESAYYIPQPQVGHVHRPHAERRMQWPEHPRGEIVFRTNNLGFREDQDTALRRPDGTVRIMVIGDSHTDGVVWNAESFPNLLEQRLGPPVEVLSCGVGYYGPTEYARFLEAYSFLDLSVVVVCLYTGNDFMDSARYLELVEGRVNPRPPGYQETVLKANRASVPATAQAFNQVYYFQTFPRMVDEALELTVNRLLEMNRFCGDRSIRFLVLLLPTRFDAMPEAEAEVLRMAPGFLGIPPSALELNRRMTGLLVERLKPRGVETVDLLEDFLASREECFWRKDHHLSCQGHRRVAGKLEAILAPHVAQLVEARRQD